MSPLTIASFAAQQRRPGDFAANPFNGPLPTYDQAVQRFCYVNHVPGCLLRDLQEQAPFPTSRSRRTAGRPRSAWRTRSATRWRSRSTTSTRRAATRSHSGQRQPHVQSRHRHPVPVLGRRSPRVSGVRRDRDDAAYRQLRLPRAADELHEAAEQPLAGLGHLHAVGVWDQDPAAAQRVQRSPVRRAPDLGGERSLAATDQRHRPVFNGIWEAGTASR